MHQPGSLALHFQRDGWEIKNQRGSHIHLIHPIKTAKVQIPNHNKGLKLGTLNAILKQAGLK
ncbi:type II toxin-antitoxin system HicA family toxin [Lutispora sp.]|uniref:type II toxin-antitoxin system HicA family toxin n=1 Tax=Lutispora sp. TaxID=2828727 RepID=UPI002B1F2E29|nr:type II toxin-antitoxin system HicA family toxin [Lutispora sp.]MEA4960422.1 type II toxin-antitoxin system HicA family toxin [Lutispora sp.]